MWFYLLLIKWFWYYVFFYFVLSAFSLLLILDKKYLNKVVSFKCCLVWHHKKFVLQAFRCVYLLPIDCDITIQGTDTTRIQLVAVGAPMHLMLSHFDTKTPIDEQGAFLLRIHYGSDQTHWTFLKTSFQDDRRLFWESQWWHLFHKLLLGLHLQTDWDFCLYWNLNDGKQKLLLFTFL